MTHPRKPQATPPGATAGWPVAGSRGDLDRRRAHLAAHRHRASPPDGAKILLNPAA